MPHLPPMDHRLRLAALIDRLVFASSSTFNRADALEALSLVPAQRRRNWLGLKVDGSAGRRGTQGVSAGFGNVRIEENRQFSFDTDGDKGIRAGQWKIARQLSHSGQERLNIEHVMAGEMDERRSACIEFNRGEPIRMLILVTKSVSIPVGWSWTKGVWRATLGFSVFVPWKTVEDTPRAEADPYDPHATNERRGM